MTTTAKTSSGVPVAGTRWAAVVAVALGIVLVGLDMTVVAVILPELGATFTASASTTQWVVLMYMLPFVALSIPAGRWLDSAGPRPAFLVAVGGFGFSSILIAVAPVLSLLLAGRGLQGFFGALIGVVGMPIIAETVHPRHRARAMSIVLTLIPLAGMAGPVVGGLLADVYGWRSVFLINVPIVLLAAWLARRTLPRSVPGKTGLPLPGIPMLREATAIAIAGTALFLALGTLASGEYVAAALLGVGAIVAAVGWTRMSESRPVLSLLRRRDLALHLLALPMITMGIGALNFLVPYLLTTEANASPTQIGMALLSLAAGMAVTSPLAGAIADRFGTRPVMLAGAAVVLAGTVTLLFIDEPHMANVAWRLALVGVGNGLFAGPNAAAILAATPTTLTGMSSGVTSLARTLGFSLGPALGALAWTLTGPGMNGFVAGVATLIAAALGALIATAFSLREDAGGTQPAT